MGSSSELEREKITQAWIRRLTFKSKESTWDGSETGETTMQWSGQLRQKWVGQRPHGWGSGPGVLQLHVRIAINICRKFEKIKMFYWKSRASKIYECDLGITQINCKERDAFSKESLKLRKFEIGIIKQKWNWKLKVTYI